MRVEGSIGRAAPYLGVSFMVAQAWGYNMLFSQKTCSFFLNLQGPLDTQA